MNKLVWTPRAEPLQPLGLLVTNELRGTVKKCLLEMDDKRLQSLRGSYCDEAVVILGDQGLLPWVPGGVYVGQESMAPHLYIPTLLSPSIPVDLLGIAIARRFGDGQFVVDPWLKQVYNLSQALSLSRERLEQSL